MENAIQSHIFEVALNWESNTGNGVAASGRRNPVIFGPPPEFGGTESTWSPEHLLATSLAACYTTTFIHFAKLLKVSVKSFRVDCKVEFTKGPSGFEATRFFLSPAVSFGQQIEQSMIDNLLGKAKKYCFISNSVKGEVVVEPAIVSN